MRTQVTNHITNIKNLKFLKGVPASSGWPNGRIFFTLAFLETRAVRFLVNEKGIFVFSVGE
jgi:hypothetical protein